MHAWYLLLAGLWFTFLSSATPPSQRIYPVKIESYLLADSQLVSAGNFYAHNKELRFEQKSFQALKNSARFIVVFAKNEGEAMVSGVLTGMIHEREFSIPVFDLPKHAEESSVWVIPVGDAYLGEGSDLPQIKMVWKEFLAK